VGGVIKEDSADSSDSFFLGVEEVGFFRGGIFSCSDLILQSSFWLIMVVLSLFTGVPYGFGICGVCRLDLLESLEVFCLAVVFFDRCLPWSFGGGS
jgi:hypothetical protein